MLEIPGHKCIPSTRIRRPMRISDGTSSSLSRIRCRAFCDNGDMCGIAGFVGAGQRDSALKATGAMVGALRRRGPDQERIESWPDAVLGHRRLAIIDLSPAGDQPMLSEDGQIGLVFN